VNVGTLRVVVAAKNGLVRSDYHNAEFKIDGDFVVITHDDDKAGMRLLSRVPIANVVQMLEQLPEKTS
jgi:hypothetical protein